MSETYQKGQAAVNVTPVTAEKPAKKAADREVEAPVETVETPEVAPDSTPEPEVEAKPAKKAAAPAKKAAAKAEKDDESSK